MRGFVDYCIQLLNEETGFKGKVDVIQPIKEGMIEHLRKQDGQYHVFAEGVSKGKKVRSKHLITCLDELINPYEDYEGFLKLAENKNLAFIFSNTTEAGIKLDASDLKIDRPPNSFPAKLLSSSSSKSILGIISSKRVSVIKLLRKSSFKAPETVVIFFNNPMGTKEVWLPLRILTFRVR